MHTLPHEQAESSGVKLNTLLRRAIEQGASDIHLKAGQPPIIRHDGELRPLQGFAPLASAQLETLVEQVAPNKFVSFGGLAAASIGTSPRSTIVLPFDGVIDYCATNSDVGRYEDCYRGVATNAQCSSKNHQVILTRR